MEAGRPVRGDWAREALPGLMGTRRSKRWVAVAAALAAALLALPAAVASPDPGDRPTPTADLDCPPVDTAGRFVAGGCRAEASSLFVDMTMRTAVGVLPFANDCGFSFALHVDRDGGTWIDDIRIGGGVGNPCNDVRPCAPAARTAQLKTPMDYQDPADFTPWRGRLLERGAGRLVNRVQLCVDTCAGRWDGTIDLGVEREDGEWRIVADRAAVGNVGLALDGEWSLSGWSPAGARPCPSGSCPQDGRTAGRAARSDPGRARPS